MIILVIGLPGAGKTVLATALAEILDISLVNADEVRYTAQDWDFSTKGRVRQAKRMSILAHALQDCVVDFVCPTEATREAFGPRSLTVWVDRIQHSVYPDTDLIWETPISDVRIKFGMTVAEEVALVVKTLASL